LQTKKKLVTKYNKKELKLKLSLKKVKVNHIKKIQNKKKDTVKKTWNFKIRTNAPKIFTKIEKKTQLQKKTKNVKIKKIKKKS